MHLKWHWPIHLAPIPIPVSYTHLYATFGGAIFNEGSQGGNLTPIIVNSIFWNNKTSSTGPVFHNNFGGNPVVSNSIIQGLANDLNDVSITFNNMSGTVSDGGNNKFQSDGIDPLFINAPLATAVPTIEGNFHIVIGSPAIDMGENTANLLPTDLDGKARIIKGTIDILSLIHI